MAIPTSFIDGLRSNKNAIGQLGLGLMQGTNIQQGLAQGVGNALGPGRQADDAYATAQKAEAERAKSINSTIEFMRQKGYDDLIARVEGGGLDIGTAWDEALRRGQAKAPKAPIEVNGQLVNPDTYEVLGDFRTPTNPNEKAPSGYQYGPDGNLAFIPGGPADPANVGKVTEAQRRNQQLAAVIQPEIQTVEDNWDELSSGMNQAAGAVPGLGGTTSEGYQKARNALTTIAQSYLYSVSGAAAPAEEVNKLVDSVTPKPFESAGSIEEKKRRIRQYADAVIQAGGAAAPGGGDDPLGIR